MKTPDANRMECLRRIASGRVDALPPCERHVLEQLQQAGLIERAPYIWLPVQLIRMTYRLTPLGKNMLHDR
jgi:hypothetical protein